MAPSARLSLLAAMLAVPLAVLLAGAARADLAVPVWYSEPGVPGGWHYRVPVVLPAAIAVRSTVVVDVDFAALLGALGVNAAAVDLDETSVRVVRSNGVLVARQEFSDRVYNGRLDAAGNARGEVRFIAEDTAAPWLYFDIVGNGAKPPAPGVSVINGNFEQSVGATPTGWVTSAISARGDQNNEVHRSAPGSTINLPAACATGGATGLDNAPNVIAGNTTGEAWHLLGYRDNCEDGNGPERVRLSRDIEVPAGAAAGVLELYFQVQGFDGITNNNNYDWVSFSVNGSAVNHNGLGIDNSGTPTLRIDSNRLGRNGYGNSALDFGWKRAVLDLAPYAGSTINFRIESRHSPNDDSHRSWVKIDDVAWSRQIASLGSPQAFGANVIVPADTAVGPVTEYTAGQTLAISLVVDARATAVTVDLLDPAQVPVAQGILLFDDGSHGDAVAQDNVWSNDGSVAGEPTHVFGASDAPGSWLVRAFARDASLASGGGTHGLLRIPGQPAAPESQANYFNVDEQVFDLGGARMALAKDVVAISDPAGGTLPKALPGAWLRYEVTVTNEGPDAADGDTVVLVDEIAPELELCVVPACTCVGACTPVDPVAFDETLSPVPTTLTFDYPSHVRYSQDGVDYGYLPVPDADGFDGAIRYVRIAPEGAMAAPTVAGNPVFVLRYVVRLR